MNVAQSQSHRASIGGGSLQRLVIGAAALLALLILAALGSERAQKPDSRAEDRITGTEQDSRGQPVFDGRGKWGGYAP